MPTGEPTTDDTPELPAKLVRARGKLGLTITQAIHRMEGHVLEGTLRTLEGQNPHRKPANGGDVKLKTAAAIIAAFWPYLRLEDFMPRTRVRAGLRDGSWGHEVRSRSREDILRMSEQK